MFISVTWLNFNQERWKKKEVIDHDVNHYYSYLPAFFYEKDLSLSFLRDNSNKDIEARYYAPNRTPAGNPVIKMTMGLAIGYLPFFALAHIYATAFDYELNGFSVPYHFAIQFSSLFYLLIGLYFLAKLLRSFFDEKMVSLTLFLICFGTNLFYYLTIRAGNVHTYDFFLVSLFLYFMAKWHRLRTKREAILMGICLGLMTLTRPTNLLFSLVFLLYDVNSLSSLGEKLKFFLKYKTQFLLVLLCFLMMVLPQLLYWHMISGKFLFNSYVGEHFFFGHPHVFAGLFSFRNGWLIYTPIMIFSLAGLFLLRQHWKSFMNAIPVFFGIYIYVTYSWWCWWYGGSFGQRSLIDVYPLLAIPLAAFLQEIRSYSKKALIIFYGVLLTFVFLNLFQTMQAKYNIIHYDSMTRASYLRVFLSTSGKPDREKYLHHPDYAAAMRGEEEN